MPETDKSGSFGGACQQSASIELFIKQICDKVPLNDDSSHDILVCEIIISALSDPSLCTFGELFHVPQVNNLINRLNLSSTLPLCKTSIFKKNFLTKLEVFHLLHIFSYGSFEDLFVSSNNSNSPTQTTPSSSSSSLQQVPISPTQWDSLLHNLRCVTILEHCLRGVKNVPLLTLIEALTIPPTHLDDNVDAEIVTLSFVESLILDCFYNNFIIGKINQEQNCLEIEWAVSRGVYVKTPGLPPILLSDSRRQLSNNPKGILLDGTTQQGMSDIESQDGAAEEQEESRRHTREIEGGHAIILQEDEMVERDDLKWMVDVLEQWRSTIVKVVDIAKEIVLEQKNNEMEELKADVETHAKHHKGLASLMSENQKKLQEQNLTSDGFGSRNYSPFQDDYVKRMRFNKNIQ